jgi:hypothetical protein
VLCSKALLFADYLALDRPNPIHFGRHFIPFFEMAAGGCLGMGLK